MKKLIVVIIIAIATFMAAIVAALPTSAATKSTVTKTTTNDFYFKDATFDYYLSKDSEGVSKMKVIENFTAVFPEYNQNHGITRVIPYTNQSGKNQTMSSADSINITVTRNGATEPISKIENDYDHNAFILYIGDKDIYVHNEQKYTLEYEFENVITDFSNYQELYWDTNGTGWSQTFNALTANLHLGSGITIEDFSKVSCYVGASGSNDQSNCKISKSSDGLSFTATNLSAGENLTFAVPFPPNTFTTFIRPVSHSNTFAIIYYIIISISTIAILVIVFSLHKKHISSKIKYYKSLATPVQYIPLKGFTVAELGGAYLGITNKNKLIQATLLELAVSHKIEIIKKDKKDYAVRITSLTDYTPRQTRVLKIIDNDKRSYFKVGDEIRILRHERVSEATSTLIRNFKYENEEELVKKQVFKETKNRTKSAAIDALCAVILFFLTFLPLVFNEDAFKGLDSPLAYIIPIASTVITIIICITLSVKANNYAKYTKYGLEVSNYAKGLEDYIKLAEKDRLAVLQSVEGADVTPAGIVKLYERLLPYAAAFGLEKTWLKQLQFYYENDNTLTPVWYVGTPGDLSLSGFATDLSSFSSTMSNMTSSSSDSGSGGGGSSGGGGGGGGGGGW